MKSSVEIKDDEEIKKLKEQLYLRDEQIKTKDNQIKLKDDQIKTKDEQMKIFRIQVLNEMIIIKDEDLEFNIPLKKRNCFHVKNIQKAKE